VVPTSPDDKAVVDYLNFLNFDAPEVVNDPRPAQVMIDEAVKAAQAGRCGGCRGG
jgi:beta-glucosidase